MSVVQIDTVFNIDLEFELAPFHKRLFAYFIDFAMLIVYLFSMKFLLYTGFEIDFRENMGLDIIIVTLPMLFYSLFAEVLMNGQTLGKKLMGIRVISLEGGEPTIGQYILRWITKFFEWPFLFGYVMLNPLALYVYIIFTGLFGIAVVIVIAITEKNQRLGDLAAGTVLVNAKTNLSVSDTVFMNVADTAYKVMFPEVMRLSDNDINTIKSVIMQANKRSQTDVTSRVEYKIKDVLQIRSDLYGLEFLNRLLSDYNYLATKE